MTFSTVSGGVTAAAGFKAAALHAGIKYSDADKLDLALVLSDQPAAAAGVYTLNQYAAAPVQWCRQVTAEGLAYGFIVNSGIANTVTGAEGRDSRPSLTYVAA